MLKRLELIGFKSFADQTAFDFADGLTGVIGPNGSGKSNVVDAVKWVLGEQSAKSLRGGEMTDVIFNGSASRRSLGMAEVSLLFDNTRKVLASNAAEVLITRRVYRSGEGEYQINGQPCRLKDVKDLFLGSGAGSDAYSIIEQGRVELLLQNSPKERRAIFEEAAGISRFKARKTESLRRLERVAANLHQLKISLDEKERNLRNVQLQASKARKHQEYSNRLRELRIGLSLSEYHALSLDRDSELQSLDTLRAALQQQTAQSENAQRELTAIDEELSHVESALVGVDRELGTARQIIAAETTRRDAEQTSLAQIEDDLARNRVRLAVATLETTALADSNRRADEELSRVEQEERERAAVVRGHEESLEDVEKRLSQLQDDIARYRGEHLEQMRLMAHLESTAVGHRAGLDNLTRERDRLRQRSRQASEGLASLDVDLAELTAAEESVGQRLMAAREAQSAARAERERLNVRREELARKTADVRAERSGRASRIEVLEELERAHEGLGTGVREVLTRLEKEKGWGGLVGLVAQVLTVRRDFAPLIDIALGPVAQRFLVRDSSALEQALSRGEPLPGRVSFLPLNGTRPAALEDPSDHPGLAAFAERVVRCDVPGLTERLLGTTLLVRDLRAAREILAEAPGYRCVTMSGELLEADGTLTVGSAAAEAGIISRRSELLELREEVRRTDRRLAALERESIILREAVATAEERAERAQTELDKLAEQAQEARWRVTQHSQRREALAAEVALSRSEADGLEEEIDRLQDAYAEASGRYEQAENEVRIARQRLEQAEREARVLEVERNAARQQATSDRVALAKVQERLSALRAGRKQREADLSAKRMEGEQAATRLSELMTRRDEFTVSLLRASSALAGWYWRLETAERTHRDGQHLRTGLRQRRQALDLRTQAWRSLWQEKQRAAHERELILASLTQTRDGLVSRLSEDYQIDLAAIYREALQAGDVLAPTGRDPATGESTTAADEIIELRRLLTKLGSVNLDSLTELTEVETEFAGLKEQYDDLMEARRELDEIIGRINDDSRKLFMEAFEAIRRHFQELFRKLFGGGQADIILEDGIDILESGIEVMARPPGKDLRGISLMSGGEKTMTAVALLLAIFRSKPSPFCILDEVDAALDEANVGRFTGVLKEFQEASQFILITHHKRTMAACDVLCGVTMTEPGVSSRYAVRFEDWPDDERKAA